MTACISLKYFISVLKRYQRGDLCHVKIVMITSSLAGSGTVLVGYICEMTTLNIWGKKGGFQGQVRLLRF